MRRLSATLSRRLPPNVLVAQRLCSSINATTDSSLQEEPGYTITELEAFPQAEAQKSLTKDSAPAAKPRTIVRSRIANLQDDTGTAPPPSAQDSAALAATDDELHAHSEVTQHTSDILRVVKDEGDDAASFATTAAEQHATVFLEQMQHLKALTDTRVVRMDPQELQEAAIRYLSVHNYLLRLKDSKLRTTRLHGRLLVKGNHLSFGVRHLVFHRVVTEIHQGSFPIDEAARLLSFEFPEALVHAKKDIRQIVAAMIMNATYATQQQQQANSKRAVPLSQDGPATPTSEGGGGIILTPSHARRLLCLVASAFPNSREIIGPLATIGWSDLDTVTDANTIIESMWAVHTARTRAPDSFWRSGIRRLVQIQRQGGVTVLQVFRALRVCKRERWSGDIASLSYLCSEALKTILDRFTNHPNRSEFQRPISAALVRSRAAAEAEYRVHQVTDGLSSQRFLSLLVLAGELGHSFQSGFDAMTEGIIGPMIRHMTRDPAALTLLSEMFRATRTHSLTLHQAMVDLLVTLNRSAKTPSRLLAPPQKNATKVQGEESVTAAELTAEPVAASPPPTKVSSTPLYKYRIQQPNSIPVIEVTMRSISRNPHFVQQLHLQPFLQLLLAVSREKRKLSPTMIITFTEHMYQIHRQLHKASVIGEDLRRAVDEFAYQLDRLLVHQLVGVSLIGKFLEYTIMLGMKSKPEVYKNMAKLRARRDELYHRVTEQKNMWGEEGVAFQGIVVDHPLRRGVAPVYQKLFTACIKLGFYREAMNARQFVELKAAAFEHGIFATLEATRLYSVLHSEKATSMEFPSVKIPSHVVAELSKAVGDRCATCGFGDDPAVVAALTQEVLHERLAVCIRLQPSAGKAVDAEIIQMVVKAFGSSPLRHQLSLNANAMGFLMALQRSTLATEESKEQIRHIISSSKQNDSS